MFSLPVQYLVLKMFLQVLCVQNSQKSPGAVLTDMWGNFLHICSFSCSFHRLVSKHGSSQIIAAF